MAIDADELVSRRPAALVRQGCLDEAGDVQGAEGEALLDLRLG